VAPDLPEGEGGAALHQRRPESRFEAMSRCDWIGASRGQIDELKETQAAILRDE
jgi:capsid protein